METQNLLFSSYEESHFYPVPQSVEQNTDQLFSKAALQVFVYVFCFYFFVK